MTFSRPRTGQVNALPNLSAPNRPRDPNFVRVDPARNGRILDFYNPNVAIRNAEAKARETEKFFENVLNLGETVYNKWEEGAVKRQVGEFLSDPEKVKNLAEGQRDLLRGNLRGAIEQIDRAVADQVFTARAELYQKLVLQSNVLSGDALRGMEPEAAEWERGKEMTRIMQEIDKLAPITGLSPAAVSEFAIKELNTKSSTNAIAYATRKQYELEGLKFGFEGQLANAVGDAARQYRDSAATQSYTKEQKDAFVEETGNKLRGILSNMRENYLWTDAETSASLYKAFLRVKARLDADFEISRDPDTLREKLAATTFIYAIAAEQGYIDRPLNDSGDTLRTALSQDEQRTRELIRAAEADAIYGRVATSVLNEDREAAASLVGTLTRIPGQGEKGLSLALTVDRFRRQPTRAEEAAEAAFVDQIMLADPANINEAEWQARFVEAGLMPEQRMRLSQLVDQRKNQGVANPFPLSNSAANQFNGEFLIAAEDILKEIPIYNTNGQVDNNALTQTAALIKSTTLAQLRKWEAEQRAAGREPTFEEIQQKFFEYLNNARATEKSKLGQVASQEAASTKERLENEYDNYVALMKKNNNKGNINMFSPEVVEGFKRKNPSAPVNFENVRKYFLGILEQFRDETGKQPFGDIRVRERRDIQQNRNEVKGVGPAGLPPSMSPYPYKRPTDSGAQSKRTDPGQGPTARLVSGIKAVGGVVASLFGGAPAQAATLTGVGGPSLPDSMAQGGAATAPPQPYNPASYTAKGPPQGSQPYTPDLVKQVRSDTGYSRPEDVVAVAAVQVLADPAGARSPSVAQAPVNAVINSTRYALDRLNEIFGGRQRLQPSTPPLPQVAPKTPATRVPLVFRSSSHPYILAIGIAEGNLTADGRPTKYYFGHSDPIDGVRQVGIFSARNSGATPEIANKVWMAKLNKVAPTFANTILSAGGREGTQEFNRLMFNLLDLYVQAPLAVMGAGGLLSRIPRLISQGATIEAVAKARADSFYNPQTGKLETGFRSYSALLRDQRARAGAYDYKRRM